MDEFPPPWFRDVQLIMREQEEMRHMVDPGGAMRQMIQESERLRDVVRPVDLPPNSTLAALAAGVDYVPPLAAMAALPDFGRTLATTIRPEISELVGREHDLLLEASRQTVGSYLAAMEDVARTATLARSLLPALELDQVLTSIYSSAEAKNLASITLSIHDLREAAVSIGSFRTAIEVGVAQIEVSPALQSALSSLDQITSGATAVWSRIAGDVGGSVSLPAPLRDVPVLQAFEGSRSIALLFSDDEEIVSARPPASLAGTRTAYLRKRLRALHPVLVSKYDGVMHATETRGPDYIAQAAASGRELLKFVIEILAPEDAVLAFHPTVQRGADGKLTRRELLNYIFRRIAGSKDYAKMVSGQIDLILGSWFPLNAAVHKLDPDLEHAQLESLVIQVEFGLIQMLHAVDLTDPS